MTSPAVHMTMFTTTLAPTETLMVLASGTYPVSSAVSSYSPVGNSGAWNRPSSSAT